METTIKKTAQYKSWNTSQRIALTYVLKIIYAALKGKWELLVMRLSNKTQEQQEQAGLKVQILFFEKTGSTSKNNCYELKLPTIILYFSLATCH